MNIFSVTARLANPQRRESRVTLDLLVDAGTTWTMLPPDTISRLGLTTSLQRAVSLEEFGLAPDPVRKTLIPVAGLLA